VASLEDIEISQKPPQQYKNYDGRKAPATQFPCTYTSRCASQKLAHIDPPVLGPA